MNDLSSSVPEPFICRAEPSTGAIFMRRTIPSDTREVQTMARYRNLATAAVFTLSLLSPAAGHAQMSDKYQPNAESKKYPEGSALERKARMSAIANNPAYTRKFDLSALPDYVRIRSLGLQYSATLRGFHSLHFALR